MRWIYYRFIYRRLMRVCHKFGWHKMREVYPDGDTMLICDWCGLRVVTHRRKHAYQEISTAQMEATK